MVTDLTKAGANLRFMEDPPLHLAIQNKMHKLPVLIRLQVLVLSVFLSFRSIEVALVTQFRSLPEYQTYIFFVN